MLIRPARLEDVPRIASWTTDTFAWGDYVAEAIPEWMEAPDSRVLVAEVEGDVVAVGRTQMVGANECWLQGARVHPDHRRKGLAGAITRSLWEWAAGQGATVARLATEDTNTAARTQAEKMGFRRVADFRRGWRAVGEGSPVPEGNGGRRVPPSERLSTAPSAEAEPALLSWSGGELARAAHGLFATGWVWRRLSVDHLLAAARSRSLFEGRPGWAMAAPDDEALEVNWLETTPDDAHAMALALVDLAAGQRAAKIKVMIPALPWLEGPLVRLGFEMLPLGVYALAL